MSKEIDEKTYFTDLEAEIEDALMPFNALISIAEDLGEDMYDFAELLKIVLEKVQGNITKIFEFIDGQLGIVKVQGVNRGEFFDFEGKRYGSYSSSELFRAFLVTGKEEKVAGGEGGA